MNRIELLAPAGSMETLKAAVNAGANAVYMGGKQFGARRSATNFTNEEMIAAIKYCHTRNVSVYVTVNTLIKEDEFSDVMDFIDFLYKNDVDAVILQDLGLLRAVKSKYLDLPCHASTQMTFHNSAGVLYAKKIGFSRVVLARELSFDEVQTIANAVDIELEVFVHGALCISYSGQCLMSSYIGGRSGNRGACAQPCRKHYTLLNRSTGEAIEKAYLMSPKDLMTYEHLAALKTLSNLSLKIEGRMKGADYVFSVVNGYRNGLDRGISNTQVTNFSKTFNRKFTEGYLFDGNYENLMNYELPSSYGTPVGTVQMIKGDTLHLKLIDTLNKGDEIQYRVNGETVGTRTDVIMLGGSRVSTAVMGAIVQIPFKHQVPINALFYKTYDKAFIDEMIKNSQVERSIHDVAFIFKASMHDRAELIMEVGGESFTTLSSQNSEAAINRPLDDQRVIEQLSKTGGTPFSVASIACFIEPNLSLPISEINHMRRTCMALYLETLEVRYPSRADIIIPELVTEASSQKDKTDVIQLVFDDVQTLFLAMSSGECESSEVVFEYLLGDIEGYQNHMEQLINWGIIPLLPRVIQEDVVDATHRFLKRYLEAHPDGRPTVALSHIGQMTFLQADRFTPIFDYSLNVMNKQSIHALGVLNAQSIVLSTELSKDEIRELGKLNMNLGVFVYGRLPLMLSEYCPVGGATVGHDRCGLCTNQSFSLLDTHGMAFPLKCDPKSCRVEVMSPKPIFLLDTLMQLKKMGITRYRMSIGNEDLLFCKNIMAAKTLEAIGLIMPYDTSNHSRGSYHRGIE